MLRRNKPFKDSFKSCNFIHSFAFHRTNQMNVSYCYTARKIIALFLYKSVNDFLINHPISPIDIYYIRITEEAEETFWLYWQDTLFYSITAAFVQKLKSLVMFDIGCCCVVIWIYKIIIIFSRSTIRRWKEFSLLMTTANERFLSRFNIYDKGESGFFDFNRRVL